MTERDDKLSRRYRELGAEEPPAALDQAILAAARRAVAPRPASQRWAVPVSLAAVLVLAVGVTLNMQHEKPGIETAPPNEYSVPQASTAPEPPAKRAEADDTRERATPPAAAVEAQVPATPPADKASELRRDAAPVAKLREKKDVAASMDQPVQKPQPKAFADAAPAEPAAQASTPPATITSANVAPPPPPAAIAPPVASAPALPAPAARPMPMAPAAPAAPAMPAGVTAQPSERQEARRAAGATARMQEAPVDAVKAKRESASADLAKETEADPRVRELERIATLRRDGKHAEADAALEKFRRDHPGYKIPDATWERVKPR